MSYGFELRYEKYVCPNCGRVWLAEEWRDWLDGDYVDGSFWKVEEIELICHDCGEIGERLNEED